MQRGTKTGQKVKENVQEEQGKGLGKISLTPIRNKTSAFFSVKAF